VRRELLNLPPPGGADNIVQACRIQRGGLGRDRSLIDEPDLTDALQNQARMHILSTCRGYPDQLLFHGSPADVTWRRVRLEPSDFTSMRYANVPRLVALSANTRLVITGASEYSGTEPDWAHFPAIRTALRLGKTFPALVAAQAAGGALVLIEGHSRATCYVLEGITSDLDAFVASSSSMTAWAFI
jgi:hypothetical protein